MSMLLAARAPMRRGHNRIVAHLVRRAAAAPLGRALSRSANPNADDWFDDDSITPIGKVAARVHRHLSDHADELDGTIAFAPRVSRCRHPSSATKRNLARSGCQLPGSKQAVSTTGGRGSGFHACEQISSAVGDALWSSTRVPTSPSRPVTNARERSGSLQVWQREARRVINPTRLAKGTS